VLLACTALVAPGFALAQAPALPQGGQFVAGQGSIGAATGNALTITQTSARGIIDWRSFNIGQGASVTVQNGAGATLNRVTGGDLSQILGSLRATGSLYLVNPQGVVIGSSGVVVTGGRFVASSLDIANDAFMAGGTLVFRGSTEHAEVRNLGSISSTGGDVILISRSVRNEGTITAPRGTAALTAGTEVLLREGPEGHRGMVRVSGASGDVTNTGRIEAAQAELRAAGGNIYALAGNTGGVIRATGTETRQGRVWLSAGAGTGGGNVVHEGRIEARNADGTGGQVTVRAGNAVSNTGTIAADGSSGGAVRVRAARVLQQGTISARGTSGAGGTITHRVTASYTDTSRAVTTADGATNSGAVRIEAEGAGATVFASGQVSATGESGVGGTVHLLGESIALMAAQVDASGASGGGVIRIGGGFQGGEGLAQAREVAINAATTIRVDATQNGHGGDAVVWSTERTRFYGTMTARGGTLGGDGGLVEISSTGELIHRGHADAAAPNGRAGSVLFDPKNIIVSNRSPSASITVAAFEIAAPWTSAGFGAATPVVLSNGNIVIANPSDSLMASNSGAVFLFNGTTGALISTLHGERFFDQVGANVTPLTNGNFVVTSPDWSNGDWTTGARYAGAATWASGTSGFIAPGPVSIANSLVGKRNDRVGTSVTALTNGNYVVLSRNFDNNGTTPLAGAATWGSGQTGVTGLVSSANSLVGSLQGRPLDSVLALANGNYLVRNPQFFYSTIDNAGAVTWGNGTTGSTGTVGLANSFVGSQSDNRVGEFVTALSNGHYVVATPGWTNGAATSAGAVTWLDGTAARTGSVSAANSLVGTTANDRVGEFVTALSNGSYVVHGPSWTNGGATSAGAATWVNGTTGLVGAVSVANSLVGTTANDRVGQIVTPLSSGTYLVQSPHWTNGAAASAGAVTWVNGSNGPVGAVSASNSLVGTQAGDQVGQSVTRLSNDNYVVLSPTWRNGSAAAVGAASWGSGASAIIGTVSSANSLVGQSAGDLTDAFVRVLSNGHFVLASPNWDNGAVANAGAVTWGNGATGSTTGTIGTNNSLVGTTTNDRVGSNLTALTNGHYVVGSPGWTNGGATSVGAATWVNGTAARTGTVSVANSLVGTTANDRVGNVITALADGSYVVRSRFWTNGSLARAGAVTWGSGTTGVTGAVSINNSFLGTVAALEFGAVGAANATTNHFILGQSSGAQGARYYALTGGDPLVLTSAYGQVPFASITISAAQLATALATGTAVTLQANNDITVATAISVAGTSGGALTLRAGRSILLNANITTGNGALTLIANDLAASGVVAAQRDTGSASITMATGTAIEAGSGDVTLRLLDGAGRDADRRAVGSISLGRVATTGTLTIDSQGAVGQATTGSAALSAGRLLIQGPGQVSLTNSANSIGTLAASMTGALDLRSAGALTIGSIGPIAGITAQSVNISSTGALTLAASVAASGTANPLLMLSSQTSNIAVTAPQSWANSTTLTLQAAAISLARR
jgi:filamentous hemagglutinin family protein